MVVVGSETFAVELFADKEDRVSVRSGTIEVRTTCAVETQFRSEEAVFEDEASHFLGKCLQDRGRARELDGNR